MLIFSYTRTLQVLELKVCGLGLGLGLGGLDYITGGYLLFFWWKSEIFLSAKPEVELIITIAPMEK